jgi:WD40 repeat protein
MTHFRRFLLALAIPFTAGLLACGGRIPVPLPKPAAVAPVVEPSFTLETGLMDCWNKKTDGPSHIIVSPDGKYLLTLAMSFKENVQVWDLTTRQKLYGIDNNIGTMHAHIAIAGDSKTAAYVQLLPKQGLVIFDLPSGKTKCRITDEKDRIFTSHSPWRSLHFSPDGSRIIFGGKAIYVWDTATGDLKSTWLGDSECLSPFFDGGSKIANYGGGRIHIRDAATGRILKSLDAGRCESLAVTRDQKTLIAGTNGEFKLFDLPGGELRKEFPMQMGTYMHIVPFPNLNMAAWPTNDGFIICDLTTGTEKQRIKVSDPYLTGLAVTPDGSTLLSASTDGKIRGWRLNAAGMAE